MAKSETKPLKYERANGDTLPCGHSRSQAAWLGCTEEGVCRPVDARISAEYLATREER